MEKFKELLAEYGQFAIAIHLLMYVCTFAVFFAIIHLGMKDWLMQFVTQYIGEDYAQAGTILLTMAATKLTQPIRLMLLIPLVPLLKSKWDERFQREG